jgi:DNA-binding transcriptional regulator YiaG
MPDTPTPSEIIDLRRRLGLNQTAFAALIGCTQAAVSRWEDGIRSPTGLYARAVTDLLARPDGVSEESVRGPRAEQ